MSMPQVSISLATTFPPTAELERETLPHPAMPIHHLHTRDIEYRTHTLIQDRQVFRYTFSSSYGFRDPLRLSIIGEITDLSAGTLSGFNFLVRCPRNATPTACSQHAHTVNLLSDIIETEPHRLTHISTTWLGDERRGPVGSLHVHATRFTRTSSGLQDGSPVYLEVTLHRYDHYVGKVIERHSLLLASGPQSELLYDKGGISLRLHRGAWHSPSPSDTTRASPDISHHGFSGLRAEWDQPTACIHSPVHSAMSLRSLFPSMVASRGNIPYLSAQGVVTCKIDAMMLVGLLKPSEDNFVDFGPKWQVAVRSFQPQMLVQLHSRYHDCTQTKPERTKMGADQMGITIFGDYIMLYGRSVPRSGPYFKIRHAEPRGFCHLPWVGPMGLKAPTAAPEFSMVVVPGDSRSPGYQVAIHTRHVQHQAFSHGKRADPVLYGEDRIAGSPGLGRLDCVVSC
ncbi:hypothetical protein C8R45DRAFT_932688 [Mycena sanguinolenta]|nr:hypothetical protein C8R45DRAFT_932688 [Mycena sanguinolenta]